MRTSSWAGRSAQSVAYFMLERIPARYAVAVLFVVACFVSTSMGTSVGTITLIAPIAVEVAQVSSFPAALCVGTVVGGAMFGDNLSFISDTTIAACNGQGCAMKDKFRGNFFIALPAALGTLAIIVLDPGDTPLSKKQLPTEAEYVEARDKYGDAFRVGMGAQAVKELLEEIDLPPEDM